MADRVTYKGTAIFAESNPLYRVTAFGSTTSLSREDLHELGNSGVVEVFDDIPTVDISLDTDEYGSIATLGLLAGKFVSGGSINIEQDFDNARADIAVQVKTPDNEEWLQYIQDAYVSGINYQFSVDGNFAENYTLVSDNKRWFRETGKYLCSYDTDEIDIQGGKITLTKTEVPGFYKLLALYALDGEDGPISKKIDMSTVTVKSATTIDIESALIDGYTHYRLIYAGGDAANRVVWTAKAKETNKSKRAGHIDIKLNDTKLEKAQSVSVNVSLDREELKQLGDDSVYARPLVVPINIDVTLEMLHADIDFIKSLCDDVEGEPDTLDMRKLKKELKLNIDIYEDLKSERKSGSPVKTFEITEMMATDEAFNVNLDSNATQQFTFRARALVITDGTVTP